MDAIYLHLILAALSISALLVWETRRIMHSTSILHRGAFYPFELKQAGKGWTMTLLDGHTVSASTKGQACGAVHDMIDTMLD